ncbi:MAG: HD-GYP domain-containing protein, partial [Spirochaetaceae bacterium]|nr:HD-GYP domain-containing protein [Spirochaetaceae bacterium]
MKIEVGSLRPGVSFTKPVYIEDDNLLVPAGIAVRKRDIEHLTRWGIYTVETEGEMVQPRLDRTGAGASQAAGGGAPSGPFIPAEGDGKGEEEQEAYRSYLGLIERLEGIFERIGRKMALENRALDEITADLLRAIREQRGRIVSFILGGEVKGRELVKSSVNTAILAARTAIALRLPPHRLMHIVTATLLHDAGMLRIPQAIPQKQGALTEDETRIMQSHTVSSYRIICKEFTYPDEVGRIALQHHERWDGQGYPRRIPGPQIDAGARIVAVVDSFEAMVREKPYRNSIAGYEAMRNLAAGFSSRFDPEVVKAFIRTLGIYPIGSTVKLNDDSIARVTEVKAASPLTPVVRVLIDGKG